MKTFESNLIFRIDGCYAAYKLRPTQYNYIANNKKFNKRDELAKIILNSNSNHIKMLGKPTFESLKHKNEEFKKTIKGPLKEEAHNYLDAVTNYMIETVGDQASNTQRYILIKLKKKKSTNMKTALIDGIKEGVKTFIDGFNTEEFSITESEYDSYKKAEDELYHRVKKLDRASEMDIEWLNRQPFYRGIGDPKLRSHVDKEGNPKYYTPTYRKIIKNGEVALSPNKHELLSLADGKVDFNNFERYMSVEHMDGRISYQSFLSVSNLPPTYFPNEEWIYGLKSLPFPVEWCFDIDVISKKKIESKVRGRRKKTLDQMENIIDSRDLPEEVLEAEHEGKTLENEISRKKAPYTFTNISFCVASDNLEELRRRVNDLVEYFTMFGENGNGIEVQNPISDQEKIFTEFMPGSTKQSTAYSRYLPIEAITSAMPTADDIIGENIGFIIGFAGPLNKPVFYDPRSPALHDKSPAISSTGGLGGGKTFLMKFNVVLSALAGGKGIYVDPKGESVNWADHIPFLKGHLEKMTLSGKNEDRGKLDPFMIYDIPSKTGEGKEAAKSSAYQLAVSKLSEMLDVPRKSRDAIAIQKACKYAVNHEVPCMERVIEFAKKEYKEHSDIEYLSTEFDELDIYLENYKEFKISSLIFGDGHGGAINFNKPITILQIQGLNIPNEKKAFENYSLEEILSQSVMDMISKLLEKVAFEDASTFVYIASDESWFMKRSASGAQSSETIIRQGRSLFTAFHTIDQNPSGITKEERNLINTKFVYQTEDIDEARSALKYLDLEESESNLDMVMNMPKYHVLYQDHNNKTDLIRINLIFGMFIDAFNTRPKEAA
jgi:hypothetical protein